MKTQAAEALTKGLYTSVAAFVLANMPKVDQVNLEEMSGTLQRAGTTMTALLAAIAAISLVVGGIGISERHARVGERANARDRPAAGRRRPPVAMLLQFLGGGGRAQLLRAVLSASPSASRRRRS